MPRPAVFLAEFGYPPYSEALVVTRTTLAGRRENASAVLPPRVGRRLAQLSCESRARQRADQASEPADERRAHRVWRAQDDEYGIVASGDARKFGLLTI